MGSSHSVDYSTRTQTINAGRDIGDTTGPGGSTQDNAAKTDAKADIRLDNSKKAGG